MSKSKCQNDFFHSKVSKLKKNSKFRDASACKHEHLHVFVMKCGTSTGLGQVHVLFWTPNFGRSVLRHLQGFEDNPVIASHRIASFLFSFLCHSVFIHQERGGPPGTFRFLKTIRYSPRLASPRLYRYSHRIASFISTPIFMTK